MLQLLITADEHSRAVVFVARRRHTECAYYLSLNFNRPRPLLIGFPVGFFQGDFVVVGRGLHAAVDVDAAGDERVFAGGDGAQVDREESPAVFLVGFSSSLASRQSPSSSFTSTVLIGVPSPQTAP